MEPRELKNHSSWIEASSWSHDAKYLATGSSDATAKIWKAPLFDLVGDLKGHQQNIHSIAWSPVSNDLATGSSDSTARIWKATEGLLASELKARIRSQLALSTSPNGKHMAIGGYNSPVRILDFSSGQIVSALEIDKKEDRTLAELWKIPGVANVIRKPSAEGIIRSVSWSPDSRKLAFLAANPSSSIEIWDIETRKRISRLPLEKSANVIAFSPDGKHLAVGRETNRAGEPATMILSALSFTTIAQFDFQQNEEKRVTVSSLAWAPDSILLARGGYNTAGGFVNVDSNSVVGTIPSPRSVSWSSDGRYVALDTGVWDAAAEDYAARFSMQAEKLLWSSDGNSLILVTGNEIQIWDRKTRSTIHKYSMENGRPTTVSWAPEGRHFFIAVDDGTIEIRPADRVDPIGTFILVDENIDWLITTPDGLFDGSPSAWPLVSWHNEADDYLAVDPVEIFFQDYYYPGLLSALLSKEQPFAPRELVSLDRRQPEVSLSANVDLSKPLDQRNVQINIAIKQAAADRRFSTGSGAYDLRLFRNGSLVRAWRGDLLRNANEIVLQTEVEIIHGNNHLAAYCFNRDNIKSSDANLLVQGSAKLKRLSNSYILAFGINRYQNSDFDLRFAVPDSHAFANVLQEKQSALGTFSNVYQRMLADEDATRQNILQEMNQLSEIVEPEDVVFIFFAGHGIATEKQFYFVPHDLEYDGLRKEIGTAGLKTILEHSLSDRDLERQFEKMDVAHIVLTIDACNAGQALEADEKRYGPMNSRGLAHLAYEKGMYILTAAQSYQAALEASSLGHGYMTFALIQEGLNRGFLAALLADASRKAAFI